MTTVSMPSIDFVGLIFNATSELIIIALFGIYLVLTWFFWTFIFPADSKTLIKAKVGWGRRRAIVLMVGDEGYAKIYLGEPLPQGVLNIGTQDKPRFLLLPRPYIPEEVLDVPRTDKDGSPLTDDQIARLQSIHDLRLEVNKYTPVHEEFALKRVFWSGLNRPVYIAYSGKAIVVAPQILASLGLPVPNKSVPATIPDDGTDTPTPKNSWINVINRVKLRGLELKTDVELLFGVLIDPRTIKMVIPNLYTDAQLRKIHSDAFEAGKEAAREGPKNLVVPVMMVMIVLVVSVVALKVAGVL